jgi:predicted transcriptional regulator
MEVLWAQGAGTVQQVLDWMPPKPTLAYNSVLTTIYKPILERKDASRSEIRHLISRFFRDSHDDLVLNILEDRGLDSGELEQLKKILQRSESK